VFGRSQKHIVLYADHKLMTPQMGGVAIYVGIEFGAISRVTILPPHAARSMI
jgi:UDP-N-acetylmuramyl pentapeptide phosphotransferase/UDP-N-acetylglucosamine-1-phosphate transferase